MSRWPLAVLLLIVAINAFGGGAYGIAGAKGIPTAWLAGSPFSSYLIPSIVLFVLVGGSSLFAAVAVLRGSARARAAAMAAAVLLLVWICGQVAIIGFVSWLQLVMLGAGIATVSLAIGLPDHR
ncbi:MAG: hypothetical protein ABL961_15525 [Vicinamibacterales bacterium]